MMPSTTTYEFGNVLLVPFPFSDQSANKKRPAIVISSRAYHQTHLDLILMAVTSQISTSRFGDLIIQDWQSAGLLKASVIKPVITTIEQKLVIRKLGTLQPSDQQDLHQLLQTILGS